MKLASTKLGCILYTNFGDKMKYLRILSKILINENQCLYCLQVYSSLGKIIIIITGNSSNVSTLVNALIPGTREMRETGKRDRYLLSLSVSVKSSASLLRQGCCLAPSGLSQFYNNTPAHTLIYMPPTENHKSQIQTLFFLICYY